MFKQRKAIASVLGLGLVGMTALGGCSTGDGDTAAPASPTQTAPVKYSSTDVFRGVIFGVGPVAGVLPELHAKTDLTRLSNMTYRQQVAGDLDRAASDFDQLGKSNAAASVRAAAARLRTPPSAQDVAVLASLQKQGLPLPQPAQIEPLLDDVRKSDGTYIDRFAAAMQSGDQVKVRDALHETARLMTNIIAARLDQAPASRAAFSTGLSFAYPLYTPAPVITQQGLSLASAQDNGAWYNINVAVDTNVAVQDNVAVANNAFIYQSSFVFSNVLYDPAYATDPLIEDTAVSAIATGLST